MTRKGSDVRGATTAKAAPQVIVGCGYLTDENLMRASRFDSYSAYYISLHSLIGKTRTDMRVRLSL